MITKKLISYLFTLSVLLSAFTFTSCDKLLDAISGASTHATTPDYFVAKNVSRLVVTGATENSCPVQIGYFPAGDYDTEQSFETFTQNTDKTYSPAIDITYLAWNDVEDRATEPRFNAAHTYSDGTLTIVITPATEAVETSE